MRKLNAKQKAYLKIKGKNWDMGELESMGDFETIFQEAERFVEDEIMKGTYDKKKSWEMY